MRRARHVQGCNPRYGARARDMRYSLRSRSAKDLGQIQLALVIDAAHDAKSTGAKRPSRSTNKLPGCISAWKKPSRKTWLKNAAAALRVMSFIQPGGLHARRIRCMETMNAFGGEHAGCAALPINCGHVKVTIVTGVVFQLFGSGGLITQIKLDAHTVSAMFPRPERA